MPTKTFDPDTGRCLVEFRIPAERQAERAWLVGEFNEWSTDACPMERDDDGSLRVVVPLDAGHTYRFRYYLGDDVWENDWAADAYVDNPHGGADSVVTVPIASSKDEAASGSLGDGVGPHRAREVVAEHGGVPDPGHPPSAD